MNYLASILLTILLIYLFILFSVYFFQRNLLYHPNENNYSGDKLLVSVEEVKIRSKDNIELKSWYHEKNVSQNKTVIFLHGNAGT